MWRLSAGLTARGWSSDDVDLAAEVHVMNITHIFGRATDFGVEVVVGGVGYADGLDDDGVPYWHPGRCGKAYLPDAV